MTLIKLHDIQREFQVGDETVHALQDVELNIEQGEYLSLMGPSGSGKSTLLNLLGLLDRPTSGLYELNGRDTTTLDDTEQAHVRGSKIGFVFQSYHLIPRLSALENVELPLMLSGAPRKQRRARVEALLGEMGLGDRMDHRPDQLSGGQRQRVAIARATVTEPELILADEPTGNLDSKSGEEVITVLERLNRLGMTLIVVTHDKAIGRRASRRLTMIDGRIDQDIRGAGT
jgi:putative ABC transport system ATP-binding protein